MKLIADCGSTKIDWVIISGDGNIVERIATRGYNAMSPNERELTSIIRDENTLLTRYCEKVKSISFFGAGCGTEKACSRVRKELVGIFPKADCLVGSDMLATARALCGNNPGIAAILGTGSNSCLYDGEKIVANVSPLGFILGDEGSGAVLGCKLIGGILKRQFSKEIIDRFYKKYDGIDASHIIEEVYRGNRSRAFLASFAPFLSENIEMEEIETFVIDEFCRFFKRNIQVYSLDEYSNMDVTALPVNFTGSIAIHFQPQLRKAAEATGYRLGKIIKSPIEELVESEKTNQPTDTSIVSTL